MNVLQRTVGVHRIGTFVAALLVGFSLKTLVPPDPATLPLFGTVPGLAVGAVGLVVGVGLLAGVRRASSGCDCAGDCKC